MKFTWSYAFQPTDRPGGIRAINQGVSGRLFDNMEGYADNTAIQAVWSSTAGTVTLETTSPMRGGKSLKLVTGAASDDLYRSIDFATFGHMFPSDGDRPSFRYVSLKMMHGGSSGNETVRFKLYDASDSSNNYAYIDLTVGTGKYTDYVIDLDTDNTESFPAITKGASFDASLIDTIAFENLADATTFYVDDIIFVYEHSLVDMVGFGSEAAIGVGQVGSVHAKLNGLIDDVKSLEFQTMQYVKQGMPSAGYDQPCTWALELLSDFAPPTTVEIEPGNYTIDRIQKDGTSSSLVGSSAASESVGTIYASYTPTPANLDAGDLMKITFSGGYIRADGTPSEAFTVQAASGQKLVTVNDSSEWTVGNLVHLSDGAGTDEWDTIASIIDPTTIQLTNNLSNTFNIADTICEAVRTDISTAVFFTRMTTEADEQEVIPLVSKCENPRVDMNAGTGIEVFRISLTNLRDVEPTAAEITNYSVDTLRFREGTDSDWTNVGISDVTMSDVDGCVIGTYDFPNAEWLPGDFCKVVVSDIKVTDATTLHEQEIPDIAVFLEVGGPPNADSTRNYTAKDVIGNKTDAIPAMDQAPGSWSLESIAKAILERVGATPSDPDDSLHTISGQRDDAAPAMDTAPASTDTLVEHLKAIRETVGQTPADPDDSLHTVVGQRDDSSDLTAATTTIVNLLRGLQGALGATPAGTGTGLEDDGSPSLVTALGTDGANVTDLAASVLGAIGANNANNAMDSSSVVSNNDGSVLERLEGILSILGTPGTTDGAGTTTTAIDSSRTEADDYWNGAVFVCLDGANAGLARPICDFDDGTDMLTFEPGFPNAVASGVSYIILNLFDVARIIGDNNANNAYDSSAVVGNIDGSMLERDEAEKAAMQIVAGGGTGFEADGTGTTLYKALVGDGSAETWADGSTAQRSLLDMPYIKAEFIGYPSPNVDGSSMQIATLSVLNMRPDSDVVQSGEITSATITIERYRRGVDTDWNAIVSSQAMTVANGYAHYSYTFPSASWEQGDLVRYKLESAVVTIAGQTFQIPTMFGSHSELRRYPDSMPTRNILVFDAFESYINDAALQAVWTDGTGNSAITREQGSPLYGTTSMKVAVGAGGDGEARKGIDVNLFGYAYELGQISAVVFQAKASTGTPTIQVRLEDVSDATNYKYWDVQLSAISAYYSVDFRSTPDGTGGGWNPALIDRLNFGSLDANTDFHFDNVVLIYEQPLLDWLNGKLNKGWTSSHITRNDDGSIPERLESIIEDLRGTNGIASFPAAADPANGVSLAEVIRAILTSLVGGDDYDGWTNISNGAITSLDGAVQAVCAVLGCDGANTFDPAMFGGSQTTLESAMSAIGTALGVEFDGTPDLYDTIVTGYDSSGISSDDDGSVLERLEDLKDRLSVVTQISTHSVTTANDTSETDISTTSATRTDQYAYSIYFDLEELETAGEGGTITLKAYNRIDSSNYRLIDKVEYVVGAGDVNPNFEFNMISHALKFTIQCSSDVTATRTVDFRAVTKDLY